MSKRRWSDLWERAGRTPGLRRYLLKAASAMVRDAERAEKRYRKFHWGDRPPDGAVSAEAPLVSPHEALDELGELVEVAYGADKAGDGAVWVHAFEVPKPVLASTSDGLLVICGGAYRVERRGIVG